MLMTENVLSRKLDKRKKIVLTILCILVPVVKDDHLLTHLPLIIFHIIPMEDGQGDDEGGGDGQK